jgi:hypothetical protein
MTKISGAVRASAIAVDARQTPNKWRRESIYRTSEKTGAVRTGFFMS